jgi:hypothetical protein
VNVRYCCQVSCGWEEIKAVYSGVFKKISVTGEEMEGRYRDCKVERVGTKYIGRG